MTVPGDVPDEYEREFLHLHGHQPDDQPETDGSGDQGDPWDNDTSGDGKSTPATDSSDEPEVSQKQAAFKGGLWVAASQVLPMIGTAALSVVIGRLLGPDDLGLQSFISYVQALLVALLFAALTGATIQSLSTAVGAKDQEGFDRLARWSVLANSAGGILAGLILVTFGAFSETPLPWYLVALTAFINSIGWGYTSIEVARNGWSAVGMRRLFTQMLSMVLGVVLVLVGFGINGVFVANLIGAVIAMVLMIKLAGRTPDARLFPFPKALLAIWGPFVLMEALSQIVSQRMEFLFLNFYSTKEQIAMYSIPFMLISAVTMFPQTLIGAGMPHVAQSAGAGEIERSAHALGYAGRVVALLSIPLCAAVAAVGPAVVIMLYGEDFTEAAHLLPLMALSLATAPLGVLYATFWTGAGRLRIPIWAFGTAGVVDLALAWILIPHYEAVGAAVANLAGQTTLSVMMVVMTSRTAHSFPLPLLRIGVVTAFSVLAFAVATEVVNLIGLTSSAMALWALIVGTVVFGVMALVYGRAIGFLAPADAQWLHHTLPPKVWFAIPFVAGPKRNLQQVDS